MKHLSVSYNGSYKLLKIFRCHLHFSSGCDPADRRSCRVSTIGAVYKWFYLLNKTVVFVLCEQFLTQRLPIFRLDYLTTTPSSLRGNRRRKSFTTDNWSAIQLVTLWNVPFVLFLIQIQTKWYCCRMSVNFCR